MLYKQIIALRRDHSALRRGDTEWLRNSDERNVVSFLRRDRNEELLVVINLSNRPFAGFVEVPVGSSFQNLTPDSVSTGPFSALPALTIESMGVRIFGRTVK